MEANRRKAIRRAIGYQAKILAADGSWNRSCRVLDVSQTGAKLAIEEADELPQDFILALSTSGPPMRRCRVVWRTQREVGVRFEKEAAEQS